MSELTVYGFPLSTYVRTVRLVCAEKGIPYDLDPIPPGEAKARGVQPFGKIPAIREGDFALYETLAIARYLDETRDGPSLQPSDPQERARMDQWISAINDAIYEAMVRQVILGYFMRRDAEGQPDRESIDAALPAVRDQLALLDAAVGQQSYLVGDDLTLADLFLGPILFYLNMVPEGPALMSEVPNLFRAYQTLAARPSFAATEPEIPAELRP